MGNYHKSKTASSGRGITLNSLKNEMYSLNMRMLLAMQNHNQEAQEEIKKQMIRVQDEIDHMNAGGRHQPLKWKYVQKGIILHPQE